MREFLCSGARLTASPDPSDTNTPADVHALIRHWSASRECYCLPPCDCFVACHRCVPRKSHHIFPYP